MTTVPDENVFNIAIEGDFDDCQQVLKSMFNDLEFKEEFSLGSINSINWARLLAQIVYYFYTSFRVMDMTGKDKVSFSVPTGNFGDIFAGYIASNMGLPIQKLVLATNENDILSHFFNTGVYSLGDVHATISPSMDIQVASNFERYLYYRCGKDAQKLSALMDGFTKSERIEVESLPDGGVDELFNAVAVDTESTLKTIREYHEKYDYLLDPHTAVGVFAGDKFMEKDVPMICLATAHPAKFSQAIIDAIGENVANHPAIDSLEGMQTRCNTLPASVDAVKEYIKGICV
jgi:threonine synthase